MKNLFFGEKHSFIEWTYVVGAHWNCIYEAIRMCTNNIRKPILKYTLNKYHYHLNISNCQSVLKYLSLNGKWFIFTWQLYHQRTSDSLNEGLPIKMTREKFQRKWYFFYEKDSRFNPRLIAQKPFSHWTSTNWKIWVENSVFAIQHIEIRKSFTEVLSPPWPN